MAHRSMTSGERELVAAWRTNHLATVYLVKNLPAALWDSPIPGIPRKTLGMLAGHIHNARCMWIKSLGEAHGIDAPRLVNLGRVRPQELLASLSRSSDGMVEVILLGVANGGRVPPAACQNFPTDMPHFLSYFAAHEGHHRGQLCMAARQLGHRLPPRVAVGIWRWKALSKVRRTIG